MSFRFKKFKVYQDSKEFTKKCLKIIQKYILAKHPSLASQLERALISITLNIAEGSGGESDVEFARFLSISIKSVNEVVSGFDLACDLNLITNECLQVIESEAGDLLKQLSSFRSTLKS